MNYTGPLVLTGPRRALGEQLDRMERLGIPVSCPRVRVGDQELEQLRRRLGDLGQFTHGRVTTAK